MGLAELENKIRETGEKEAGAIIEDAKTEAEKIRKGYRGEARKKAVDAMERAKTEAELIKKRIVTDARLEAKEMVDIKRNELIEEVFTEAGKEVEKLSKTEKKKILSRLAEEGKKQIDDPVVYVDRKYSSLLKGAKGTKLNDFGVLVKSRKGESEVNNTLSKKLEEFRDTLKHGIAEVLFND